MVTWTRWYCYRGCVWCLAAYSPKAYKEARLGERKFALFKMLATGWENGGHQSKGQFPPHVHSDKQGVRAFIGG